MGEGKKGKCEREHGEGVPHYSAEEGGQVADGVQGVADVDVVVFVFRVDPFFFKVVDEEMDVFRDKIGLDRREVDAGYCSVWIFVADCG